MNRLGELWVLTTFGESHGAGIGCVLDGVPAGLRVDEEFLNLELSRRRPGGSLYSTPRKESDRVEILSGVMEGFTTGTPLAMFIPNENQKSSDYESIRSIFRPGHADFTYHYKYGLRDHRGGGRSSARETAARVAGGAVAKMFLKELGISISSGVFQVGEHTSDVRDFAHARKSVVNALDPLMEELFKEEIEKARGAHDSIGGAIEVRAKGMPIGLGEPLYHKLDGALGGALMGLNAVKAVEIGEGLSAARLKGSENNDPLRLEGFKSNHAGGILGGISNGSELVARVYFKPTPSIFLPQETLNEEGDEVICALKGRHDPCVAIRGGVVCEALVALVLADMALLRLGNRLQDVKEFYGKGR